MYQNSSVCPSYNPYGKWTLCVGVIGVLLAAIGLTYAIKTKHKNTIIKCVILFLGCCYATYWAVLVGNWIDIGCGAITIF
jgi:hypothetical protein